MRPTVEVTSLAYGGDGIARIDGQVCFVPAGLPGDVVQVEIVRRAKGVLWGRITDVCTPSPDRLPEADGTHRRQSAGDEWGHFAYPAQAAWKQRLVREALSRYAGIEVDLAWVEEPALRHGWRTRAELHGDGARLGFFAQGTHEIVEAACPLLHPRLAALADALRATGWCRDVTLTVDPEGDAAMAFGARPTEAAQGVVGAWDTPRSDEPRARFMFDGVPIVNGTFCQSSLLLNRLLRRTVDASLQASGALFDAYCGNGNLSLGHVATRPVSGMDIASPAVEAARALGGDYRDGDTWAMADALRGGTWGSIVLDPPRTGAKDLVPALLNVRAEEIIYVGCDPVALARDLKAITVGGWRVRSATALDLFPNTAHTETVVRLTR